MGRIWGFQKEVAAAVIADAQVIALSQMASAALWDTDETGGADPVANRSHTAPTPGAFAVVVRQNGSGYIASHTRDLTRSRLVSVRAKAMRCHRLLQEIEAEQRPHDRLDIYYRLFILTDDLHKNCLSKYNLSRNLNHTETETIIGILGGG